MFFTCPWNNEKTNPLSNDKSDYYILPANFTLLYYPNITTSRSLQPPKVGEEFNVKEELFQQIDAYFKAKAIQENHLVNKEQNLTNEAKNRSEELLQKIEDLALQTYLKKIKGKLYIDTGNKQQLVGEWILNHINVQANQQQSPEQKQHSFYSQLNAFFNLPKINFSSWQDYADMNSWMKSEKEKEKGKSQEQLFIK